MQDKTNEAAETKIPRRHSTKEERQAHVKKWQESGLTVTEYCRRHHIPLPRFISWKQSASKLNQVFKPVVTIPSTATKMKAESESNVIEIVTEHAIKIRLVNVVDASMVVDIARGLSQCN